MRNSAYTLIEVLVTISIMALLVGITYPNYRAYQRRQEVKQLGQQLETNLRFAQQLSLSGERPDQPPCNVPIPVPKTFAGIRVAVTSTTQYTFSALCDASPTLMRTYDLPANAVIKHNLPGAKFTFKELGKGTDLSGTYYIGVCVGSDGYGYNVNASGQISKIDTFSCP